MAMSANSVMMKFFKLPPAMRMILAVAGFGSLASIIFMLLPALRTREGKMWVLIIGGIGLLLFLLIWGIRRLFFKKKSSKLSDALDSQGPSRGDIAEQEKIYREKFRAKLADLKTNGLDVYKLPWFVLMGEPGCGKTASLIHSGLDFPLGKDEVPGFGGTRNYNWWFTNEAVILDTAGRIAFQEEGTTDRTEWEFFLKLLKLNRPRYPLNGLVIALPADKLLRDNSEERTQKATILRERLRQVHQTLGVRFPTFVLVTKMDLAGGFTEFFEEIRVDLQQRNQMFGWSRPGEFSDTYEPASFPEAFDQVYQRIRSWGMRYLQRKATEEELGMIVTFPESFRQLRDPLNDYISTIFQKSPLLEPPFFRGFYFTSAVQEGAPIFDVFAKSKAGITVQERPTKAVDSKAFFIHDLYSNKVFPENGLVFRSAKHVSLNKRMRRVVWAGSAAMVLMMVMLFFFGQSGTHDLLEAPRDNCVSAVEAIEKKSARYEELNANLRIAKDLRENYVRYSEGLTWLYAKLLFIGADIDVPQDAVGQIHARFVLDCVFRPVLARVEQNLIEANIKAASTQKRERYLAALEVYTKWYGEVVGQHELVELDGQRASVRRSEFEALLAFLETPEADFKDAAEQFETALTTLSRNSRSFAMEILRDNMSYDEENEIAEREEIFDSARVTEVILAGVEKITQSWMPYTQLTADNTNPKVKYWADFAARVGDLRDRFDELLSLTDGFADDSLYPDSVERFMILTAGVEYLNDPRITIAEPGSLHEAFFNLMIFLDSTQVPETAEHKIIRFAGLLDIFREQWGREYELVQVALEIGAPEMDHDPQADVYQAIINDQANLERAFNNSLAQIRTRLGLPKGEEPLTFYANQNLIELDEYDDMPPPREEPARILLTSDVLGFSEQLKNYLIELRAMVGGAQQELQALEDLRRWPALLQGLSAAEPAGKLLNLWFSQVESAPSANSVTRNDIIKRASGLADNPFWRPVDLYNLADRMWLARRSNSTGFLLAQMAEKAEATLREERMPGLARLMPGFDQPSTLPFNVHRFNQAQEAPPEEPAITAPPEEEEADDGGLGRIGRRRQAEPEPEEADLARQSLKREETSALLYDYHTLNFMLTTLRQFEHTLTALEQHSGGDKVRAPLTRAADVYIETYFGEWHDIYSDPTRLLDADTLGFLEKCRDAELSWPEYVTIMHEEGGAFATALANRMEALIREVVMFDMDLVQGNEVDDAVYDRLVRRLSKLNNESRSITHRLQAMRERRNQPDRAHGDPEVAYSQRLEYAWQKYRKSVRGIGALTDGSRGASEQPAPPDLEELAEEIVYKQATSTDSPLIAPLMDIADYGQHLLVHHLDAELTKLFATHVGEYPLVYPEDARDDSALLTGLADRKTMAPRAFIDLLREVAKFQKQYGPLYSQVQNEDSPSYHTLDLCEAWIKFLYGDPKKLMRKMDVDDTPPDLDVFVTAVHDPSGDVVNAGNVYSKVTIVLPLMTTQRDAAPPINFSTRAGEGVKVSTVQAAIQADPDEYRWNLFDSGDSSFGHMSITVSDRHPEARSEYAERLDGWRLPRTPWMLLMAMGARNTNDLKRGYWKIPVRMETFDDPIGFVVGLQIGNSERPFPGAIPPLEDPGPRPGMRKAEKYLPGQ